MIKMPLFVAAPGEYQPGPIQGVPTCRPRHLAYHVSSARPIVWLVTREDETCILHTPRHIRDCPTPWLIRAAQIRGSILGLIPDPDFEVQMAAVESDPMAIQYIARPDPDVQMHAIQSKLAAIQWIREPALDAIIPRPLGHKNYSEPRTRSVQSRNDGYPAKTKN